MNKMELRALACHEGIVCNQEDCGVCDEMITKLIKLNKEVKKHGHSGFQRKVPK